MFKLEIVLFMHMFITSHFGLKCKINDQSTDFMTTV